MAHCTFRSLDQGGLTRPAKRPKSSPGSGSVCTSEASVCDKLLHQAGALVDVRQHCSMSLAKHTQPVLCGLPGDVQHASDVEDHSFAKVGGQAVFPGSSPPSDLLQARLVCHACGKRMLMIAQVPTPSQHGLQDRVLMLWACASSDCAKDLSSWKAFSCQMHCKQETQGTATTQNMNHAAVASTEDVSKPSQHLQEPGYSSDWGLDTDDNWGDAKPGDTQNVANQSPFDFSDLEQALSTAHGSKSSVGQQQHSQAATQPQTENQHQATSSCTAEGKLAGPQLPGFYLHMTSESAGASASMSAEEQHIAELVAAYHADNQQAGLSQQAADDSNEWGGEAYEEDKERAFLKFCRQVQQVPQQCIRYSRGGVPIWPKKQKLSPGRCLHCGQQQIFEMQTLAPMLHFLEETCTWLMDEESSCYAEQIQSAMQVLSGWQWLTVAVFTCPNACQAHQQCSDTNNAGQCSWQEETVMLATEDS